VGKPAQSSDTTFYPDCFFLFVLVFNAYFRFSTIYVLPTYALSFVPTVRLRYLVATQLHTFAVALRCVALRGVDVDVDVDVDVR
jgi:hypothetical protein